MRGVCKRFGATRALDGVDLDLRAGEVHALVGENGAGKSTLMKILSGALRADRGELWLEGDRYRPRSPVDGRRAGVAMIYQELSLAPHLSVMENILLGAEPVVGPFVRWNEVRKRARQALRRVGRAELSLTTPVRRLSIADQQLVEIARSLAVGCRVLVLDEPTSSLSQDGIERLFGLVRKLRDDGHAIVYISHFLDEVREISDRYSVLRDGRTVGEGLTRDAKTGSLVRLMVGREVSELYPRSRRSPGEVLLDVRGMSGVRVPADASISLRRGEVVGIAGLIGSGRTEFMRAVFGLDRVQRGEVRVARVGGPAAPALRWRQGVGMVSEDRKNEGLAINLSVADNITLPKLRGLGPWGSVTPRGQAAASQTWVERLGIRCLSPAQRVDSLSGGNQQKIALARLLHADVDVFLLDEPTRGIDVASKALIYQLIDDLAAGRAVQECPPKAVLMVSSYLPELLGVCDRIAVMHRGKLGPARAVAEIDEHSIMREAGGAEQVA